MGLGFHTKAPLVARRTGFLRREKQLTVDQLKAGCRRFAERTPLAPLVVFNELWDQAPGFSFSLHPAEEGIDFRFEEADVVASAKTSSAGPGYHACAIELLDFLKTELGLNWFFGNEEDDYQDETGYVHTRDFSQLQHKCAGLFGQLCRISLEHLQEGHESLRMSMPLDFAVIFNGAEGFTRGTLTQLGPLGEVDLQRGANGSAEERERVAKRYFPWWEKGFGADFYAKLALNDLWMGQPWTAPMDEAERQQMHRTLEWFATARRLDPALELPDLAIAELRKFARSSEEATLAKPGPIGYRRHTFQRRLTGDWKIHVPGCLRSLPGEDDETVIYGVSDLVLHASSLIAIANEGARPNPIENEGAFDDASLRGKVEPPKTSEGGFVMNAYATADIDDKTVTVATATIWYATESLEPLAHQVLRSLKHDPPQRRDDVRED